MKKLLAALALSATTLTAPALADPDIQRWNTNHSLGCMLTRECVEETWLLKDINDIKEVLPHVVYDNVEAEANALIAELEKLNVNVYLAADKYFPRGNAGVYYVSGNDLFLNMTWADDPDTMIRTLRHEGWHAAQDAMAGTVENTMMAVILGEAKVPQGYKLMVEIAYPPSARPWEMEAKWAGDVENMTLDVLRQINTSNGRPWDVIEPTPLTRLWLERNGYL